MNETTTQYQVIETSYTIRPEDLGCYDANVIPTIQYLTDPQVRPEKPSYRFYADLYHKHDPDAHLLADIVSLNCSLAALNRIVKSSSLGSGYYVAKWWVPESESNEPF